MRKYTNTIVSCTKSWLLFRPHKLIIKVPIQKFSLCLTFLWCWSMNINLSAEWSLPWESIKWLAIPHVPFLSFLVVLLRNVWLVIWQSRFKISGRANSLQITSQEINNILRSTRKRLILYDLPVHRGWTERHTGGETFILHYNYFTVLVRIPDRWH